MSKTRISRAALAALFSLSGLASAQNFPARAITLVVPFTPGGVTDPVARHVGAKVSQNIGQQVLIENKPGAAGNIGAEAVKRASPDALSTQPT